MITVRAETEGDIPAVRYVNEQAFGRPGEADLVDALRAAAEPTLSLVALQEGRVVGHLLFSPVTLKTDVERDTPTAGAYLGLAPLAVLPEFQNRGIGSSLMREGLETCRRLGAEAVVVLGHPEYYPRFGFVPAVRYGLRCEYPVPDDVFMALELKPGALAVPGLVKYHPAFAGV